MEIRGYGVVLVVHGGYEVVVHGYEVVVRGYEVVFRENGEVVQRDCVAGYDCVEVCGCVDHKDLAEIAGALEVDHVDAVVDHHADVRREARADVPEADRDDVRREARVRGEDLVPAAVEC